MLVLLNAYFSFGQCTIALNLNINNATDSSSCNGSVVANPSGNYGPVTYAWNCNTCTNVYSSSMDSLCYGSSGTVTVTDTLGCSATANWTIGNAPCSNFGATVQTTNASVTDACDGSILVTPFGGTAPFNYSIQNADSLYTSNNPSNLCPGQYSINVTDNSGCDFVSTTNISVLDSCAGLAINFSNLINPTSVSSCDASVSVIVSGGSGPYTYDWSNGLTSQNADSLCNGVYNVCVTSSNGCQVCDSISISASSNVCQGFFATAQINNATDSVTCDGSMIVYAYGGTWPCSFSFNNSTPTYDSTSMNLCIGTYVATVTDANGCSYTVTGTVDTDSVNLQCQGFSAIAQITNASDSVTCDGSMSVIVSNGLAPYSYIFFNTDTTSNSIANNLCVGNYSATVFDANGCSVSVSGNVNAEIIVPGDTIVLNDDIVIDSSFVGTDSSEWINNCSIYYDSIISAYISNYSAISVDSVLINWVLGYDNGDSVLISTSYNLNSGYGTYLLTLLMYCPLKSEPKYLVVNSAFDFQQSSLLESSLTSLNLYPNPTSDFLYIEGANLNSLYEIVDLKGKILSQGKYDNKIDVTNLSRGTYLVKVSNNNKSAVLRFVK